MAADKIIHFDRLERNDLQSLQGALTKAISHARVASCTLRAKLGFGGSSTILIEDEDGWNITGVALVEQTLSDGSRVYTARLLFGEASAKLQADIDTLTRHTKRLAIQKARPRQPKPDTSTPQAAAGGPNDSKNPKKENI